MEGQYNQPPPGPPPPIKQPVPTRRIPTPDELNARDAYAGMVQSRGSPNRSFKADLLDNTYMSRADQCAFAVRMTLELLMHQPTTPIPPYLPNLIDTYYAYEVQPQAPTGVTSLEALAQSQAANPLPDQLTATQWFDQLANQKRQQGFSARHTTFQENVLDERYMTREEVCNIAVRMTRELYRRNPHTPIPTYFPDLVTRYTREIGFTAAPASPNLTPPELFRPAGGNQPASTPGADRPPLPASSLQVINMRPAQSWQQQGQQDIRPASPALVNQPQPIPAVDRTVSSAVPGFQKIAERPALVPRSAEQVKPPEQVLADATRQHGFGYLYGKFPRTLVDNSNAQCIGGFILGEKVSREDSTDIGKMARFHLEYPPAEFRQTYTPPPRFVLTVSRYTPPSHTYEQGKGVFGKQRVTNVYNYKGKQGQEGWVQYDYYMPIPAVYDTGKERSGTNVFLTVVVPPALAEQIDRNVAQNPLFFDRYFQALYPGIVGQDVTTHIRRNPATELDIRDTRPNPSLRSGRINFPQPIPF